MDYTAISIFCLIPLGFGFLNEYSRANNIKKATNAIRKRANDLYQADLISRGVDISLLPTESEE
jgi:hypothetical protein